MNTNQTFIGAYARNRRRSGATNDSTLTGQRVPAPHIQTAPAEPAPNPDPPTPIAPSLESPSVSEPDTDRQSVTIEQAASVSHAVAANTEVWVNQIEGQILRVDAPGTSPLTPETVDRTIDHTPPQPAEPTLELEPVRTEEPIEVAAPQPSATVDPVATVDRVLESSPLSPAPVRWAGAAWEVDAFDLPQIVAELFFDEAFFRSIAEHMGQSVRSGLRSVLVTSIGKGEGRSTVTIGTAIAAAATGLRIALVDIDLEAPSQADQLRLEIESDWVTAIRQGDSIESISIASVEDGVTLIPLSALDNRSLPITSMEIDRLLGRLEGCFDLVIFDGPKIDSWATARIAAAVDSSLIIRDTRTTQETEVVIAADRLRRQGVQGIGVVDNFCG